MRRGVFLWLFRRGGRRYGLCISLSGLLLPPSKTRVTMSSSESNFERLWMGNTGDVSPNPISSFRGFDVVGSRLFRCDIHHHAAINPYLDIPSHSHGSSPHCTLPAPAF